MAMTRIEGFEGDRPFLDVASSQPGTRIIATARRRSGRATSRAAARRQRSSRGCCSAWSARTQAAFPVTYTYAGQAESPDGTAHVIDVTGADDFKARLFLDSRHPPAADAHLHRARAAANANGDAARRAAGGANTEGGDGAGGSGRRARNAAS